MSDGLGERLLISILEEKTLEPFAQAQLSEEDLFDSAKKGFLFVQDFRRKYGDFPTVAQVEKEIGTAIASIPEPLAFVVEEVRKRALTRRLREGYLKPAIEALDARDPDLALSECISASKLNRISKGSKIVSSRESGPSRVEEYERMAAGAINYLPTPWEHLNDRILGWFEGEFHTVVALPNVGKTWVACICANHAFTVQGHKVLFVTLEMSERRISRRVDALRYKLPWGEFRKHKLDPAIEKQWKDAVALDVKGDGDIVYADKRVVSKVSDVEALVYEHKPNIVIVDGGYRFTASRGGAGEWKNTVEIVNDLQLAAEFTGIPWVVTSQLGDSNETGKKPTAEKTLRGWNVRYGKEWFINPDVVVGIYQDEELRLEKSLLLETLKIRDADEAMTTLEKLYINWDMTKMDFAQKSSELGSESVGDEESLI